MSRILIGLRAYLTGDNDAELAMQVGEAKKFFPRCFLLVALCGRPPTKMVLEVADEVLHYSNPPLGLTPPFHIIIEYAKKHGFMECILTDGDEQHMFSEIRRVYGGSADKAVIPVRENRSLFFSDDNGSGIDRPTLEDAENAFLRIRDGCMHTDPQPGLVILKTNAALGAVELSQVPSMIGDIAITTQLFLAGMRIDAPLIKIRKQEKTRVNLALEFEKVSQLESYYSLGFRTVVEKCSNAPEKYLPRGNPNELRCILDAFLDWKTSVR